MDAQSGRLLEGLQHQHCHFPIPKRRSRDVSHFECVEVFGQSEEVAQGSLTPEHLKTLVQSAWAVTLRNYVRSDFVCFVVRSTIEDCDDSSGLRGKPSSLSSENVRILQYQISDHSSLSEIHALGTLLYQRKDLRDRQINTAVHDTTLMSKHDREPKDETCLPNSLQPDILGNEVRSIFVK